MSVTEIIGRVARGERVGIDFEQVAEVNGIWCEIGQEPLITSYSKKTGKTEVWVANFDEMREAYSVLKEAIHSSSPPPHQ